MANSFSGVPDIITFTLGGSDVATKVNVPNNGRKVTLYFVTNPGKFAHTGTDAAAIDSAHMLVRADEPYEVWLDQDTLDQGKGPGELYVAAAIASTVVRLHVEAGG